MKTSPSFLDPSPRSPVKLNPYFSVEKILIGSSSESVELVDDDTAQEDAEELLGYAIMLEKTITLNVDGEAKAVPKQGIFIENSNVQFKAGSSAQPAVAAVQPVSVNGVDKMNAQSGVYNVFLLVHPLHSAPPPPNGYKNSVTFF